MSENNINQELVMILGEIRGQLSVLTDFIKRGDERVTQLEIRVRSIEHASAKVIGAAVALSGVMTFCLDWFLK